MRPIRRISSLGERLFNIPQPSAIWTPPPRPLVSSSGLIYTDAGQRSTVALTSWRSAGVHTTSRQLGVEPPGYSDRRPPAACIHSSCVGSALKYRLRWRSGAAVEELLTAEWRPKWRNFASDEKKRIVKLAATMSTRAELLRTTNDASVCDVTNAARQFHAPCILLHAACVCTPLDQGTADDWYRTGGRRYGKS